MIKSHESNKKSNQWDGYAPSFSTITTFYQAQLYRAAGLLLAGHVADFGSGPAKLAPYLVCNDKITSYVGVDSSSEMVALSEKMLGALKDSRFKAVCCAIEDFENNGFTGAVSLNSYYAWGSPERVLRKIVSVLSSGADFILATPNPTLDMGLIMMESRKELILQAEFYSFKKWNEIFAETKRDRFVSMDDLIGELREVGFKIVDCHTKFYEGGLNFVHARKQ